MRHHCCCTLNETSPDMARAPPCSAMLRHGLDAEVEGAAKNQGPGDSWDDPMWLPSGNDKNHRKTVGKP